MAASAKSVGAVKLSVAKYMDAEENDIVSLNNRIIEQDPSTVSILVLTKDSARVFVGAGKGAIAHGVHAGNLARKLAVIVGGGGGGKDYFGQGGGTNLGAADEAVRKSEQLVKEMLTK